MNFLIGYLIFCAALFAFSLWYEYTEYPYSYLVVKDILVMIGFCIMPIWNLIYLYMQLDNLDWLNFDRFWQKFNFEPVKILLNKTVIKGKLNNVNED